MNLLCAKVMMSLAVASGGGSHLPPPSLDLVAQRTQFVRTNAPRFWSFASHTENIEPLKDYVAFEGVVAGDPNLGNFSPSLVKTEKGDSQMRYVDIDFDDAGQGSFALNITLFLANIKLMAPDIELNDILKAYKNGLEGHRTRPTPAVRDLLNLSVREYEKKLDELVDEKTKAGHFQFKPGSIEPYSAPYSMQEIQALFPEDKILDLAIRRKKVGGSMKAQRIWILTENASGKIKIMELKEVLPSGLELYRPQQDLPTRLQQIYKNLWPGLSPDSYRVVQMSDQRSFWLRRKSVALINAPYLIKNKNEFNYVKELALYDANLMGRLDGAQAEAAAFKKAIRKNPKKFREAIKKTVANFLEQAVPSSSNTSNAEPE